ncbi:hypothetical protein FRB95_002248 [Tulasnella sp. JGI-2019a]|nr:hypothetical protein FRB95_002248 [Tulasnella sp. JGI-2019a]
MAFLTKTLRSLSNKYPKPSSHTTHDENRQPSPCRDTTAIHQTKLSKLLSKIVLTLDKKAASDRKDESTPSPAMMCASQWRAENRFSETRLAPTPTLISPRPLLGEKATVKSLTAGDDSENVARQHNQEAQWYHLSTDTPSDTTSELDFPPSTKPRLTAADIMAYRNGGVTITPVLPPTKVPAAYAQTTAPTTVEPITPALSWKEDPVNEPRKEIHQNILSPSSTLVTLAELSGEGHGRIEGYGYMKSSLNKEVHWSNPSVCTVDATGCVDAVHIDISNEQERALASATRVPPSGSDFSLSDTEVYGSPTEARCSYRQSVRSTMSRSDSDCYGSPTDVGCARSTDLLPSAPSHTSLSLQAAIREGGDSDRCICGCDGTTFPHAMAMSSPAARDQKMVKTDHGVPGLLRRTLKSVGFALRSRNSRTKST